MPRNGCERGGGRRRSRRGCGSRPAARATRRARAARRAARAAPAASRRRGGRRARSPRPRRPSDARAARAARRRGPPRRVAALMRVDAERGDDALVALGDLERAPARVDSRPDRHDPRDAGGVRTCDDRVRLRRTRRGGRGCRSRRGRGLVDAREERRAPARALRPARVRPYATSSQRRVVGWPERLEDRARTCPGRYEASATATARSPSTRS